MLKGSIVALVTPFTKSEEIDEERLRFLINWHIKNKTDAILVCGTTGESATLSHSEHKKVIDIAVDEAKKRISVVAGCGSNSTKEALELTHYAKKRGADFALIITPYYNKPTQEGMYQHYKKIADSVAIPIVVYNVPSRTGINILPSTTSALYKDYKNIIGIKEASGSLDQMIKLMGLVDKEFVLLSGDDALTLPIMSIGGVGVVSVIANIVPHQVHNLVASFLDGNIEEARKLQLELYELIKMMFIETNPIPVKTSLGLMGLIDPVLRLPLYRIGEANLGKLKSSLKKYKLI